MDGEELDVDVAGGGFGVEGLEAGLEQGEVDEGGLGG